MENMDPLLLAAKNYNDLKDKEGDLKKLIHPELSRQSKQFLCQIIWPIVHFQLRFCTTPKTALN